MGGAGRRRNHLVEVRLDLFVGHLDARPKADLDELQKGALPEQFVHEILFGDSVFRQ